MNADGDCSAPAAEPLVLTIASADSATVSLTTGQEALVPYAGGACATDSGKSDLDLTLTASGTGYSGRACLRGDPGIHLVVAEQGRAEAELRVTLTEPPVPTLDLSAPTATLDGGELYASTVEPLVLLVSSDDGGDVHLTTGETALVPVVGGVCSGTPSDEIALSLDPVGTGNAAEVCLDGSAGVHLVLAEQGAASEELRFTLVDPPEFFPTSVALTTGTTVWLTLPASLTASEPMTHLSCYVVGDSAIQVVDTASGTDVVLTASAVSFAAPTALSVSAGVGAVSGDSARLTCTDGLGQSAFVNFTVE